MVKHKSDEAKRKRSRTSKKPDINHILKEYKIMLIVVFILIISVLSIFYGSQYFPNTEGDEEEYSLAKITEFKTLSEYNGVDNYTEETYFNRGDEVIVYQEYINISHNNKADFSLTISIINSFDNKEYYSKQDSHIKDAGEKGSYWPFLVDETWPYGAYLISLSLEDHISEHTAYDFAIIFVEQ